MTPQAMGDLTLWEYTALMYEWNARHKTDKKKVDVSEEEWSEFEDNVLSLPGYKPEADAGLG